MSPERRMDMEDNAAVAVSLAQLVNYRREQRITQQQIAERLGISQASVARMEHAFSLRSLQLLARGMGIKVELTLSKKGKQIFSKNANT